MTPDNSSVFLKQLSHLSLSQPYSFILQPYIDGSLAVVGLVDDNLIFHGAVLCGKDNKKVVQVYGTGCLNA